MKKIPVFLLLFCLAGAASAAAHAPGPEDHRVILSVRGDRIAVDYEIFFTANPSAADVSGAAHLDRNDRAAQLAGLQRLTIDGRLIALRFLISEERPSSWHFRFDTGPASLTAGEHEIGYRAHTALVARTFQLRRTAEDGSRLLADSTPETGGAEWRGRVAASGREPAVATTAVETPSGLWANLIERVRAGGGWPFWMITAALAFLFGLLHGLGPGHGKNLALAYFLDRQGNTADVLVFALTTALSHTFLAFCLAFAARWWRADLSSATLLPWLQLGAGGLMAVLGAWLLIHRLPGVHGHFFSGHPHVHPHHRGPALPPDSAAPPRIEKARKRKTALLGLAAGAAPCPEALALLFVAIGANRAGVGLFLLVFFSLGLSSVLVLVGLAVVHAGGWLARIFPERESGLVRWLSLFSAGAVLAIGCWFIGASVAGLF
ncbi:MAG: hypothetical protein GX444_03510 [Myxococcales bacterium]|nr:hypothetical protein [Myxococcales bacterium]